jgi:ligand-binding sensor domain-containing protein
LVRGDGGICKLPIEKFKIYNKLSGLPQENVFAIYKDKNNTLWFGHKDTELLKFQLTA